MLTNDLFNTDYERRLNEGAVDQLEQRRIDDLNMKMDELAKRVKTTADKAHRESLLKAFLKCKEERDSYYKVKTNEGSMKQWLWNEAERLDRDRFIANAGEYGMTDEEAAEWWDDINGVNEAGIGQDLVTPQQRVQQSTPQKQTPIQKVGSTVKHAANWLAGKGGPGKEGTTYEGQEHNDDDYEQILNAIAALYGPKIWDNDAMGDLANDLEQVNPTPEELNFIIKHGKLPKRLKGMQFTNNDTVQFGEAAYTGDRDTDEKHIQHLMKKYHWTRQEAEEHLTSSESNKEKFDESSESDSINPNAKCRVCKTPFNKHFRFSPEGKILSSTVRGPCGRTRKDFPDLQTSENTQDTGAQRQSKELPDYNEWMAKIKAKYPNVRFVVEKMPGGATFADVPGKGRVATYPRTAPFGRVGQSKVATELDEQTSPVNTAKLVWAQIAKAVNSNVDVATITWPNGESQKLTRNQLWHIDQKARTMSRQARNQFALKTFVDVNNLMYYLGTLKAVKPRPQLRPEVDPSQPSLDLPKPTLEDSKKKDSLTTPGDPESDVAIKLARSRNPTAKSDLAAVVKDKITTDKTVKKDIDQVKADNERQEKEIQRLEKETDALSIAASGAGKLKNFDTDANPTTPLPPSAGAFVPAPSIPPAPITTTPDIASPVSYPSPEPTTAKDTDVTPEPTPTKDLETPVTKPPRVQYRQVSQPTRLSNRPTRAPSLPAPETPDTIPLDFGPGWEEVPATNNKKLSADDDFDIINFDDALAADETDAVIKKASGKTTKKQRSRATAESVDESQMSELDATRQDLELMSERQFYVAYGMSKAAFQQKYRTLLNPAQSQDIPIKEDSAMTQHEWMKAMKQQYPGVTFAQNKTTMKLFAMVPGRGKVGEFDQRTTVNELEVADLVRPGTQTDTPPRKAYSIALEGKPGRDYRAEKAWEALNKVFPREYPYTERQAGAAQEKVLEVLKRGSAIVKTGINSEDIADSYVAKLGQFVPAQYWRIIGGDLEESMDDDWDEDEGDYVNDPEAHAQVRNQPLPDSVLRAIERNPAMRADIIAAYKRQHGITEKKLGQNRPKLGTARDIGKSVRKFRQQSGLAEGPDLINMSDLQFYKELLAVLVIPIAGLGAATWHRAQNALKLYRAEDVINALNKKGITVDRATLGQIKPLLLKLEQAIDVDRDGDAAKELAQRIQQTVAWGKLTQAPARSATPVTRRGEQEVDEASWGGSGPAGLKTPYAVYTKQNGQVKRVKTTNKIGEPMNTREAEAYVAAMRKRDPARWTHDTVWVAPADIDLDEEQKPFNPNEFRPVGPITIVPPKKLKSGQTYQDQNKYWQSQGQAPIYKTNEAANPAQQAAIAIAMKRAGKKPKSVDEELDAIEENLRDWFGKEKWVRMDTKGNIKGACARGSESEGKPKCLPQAKAHALGKKGRASAAQKKRREDPNPERRGKAINVATKVKEQGAYIGKSLTSVQILEYIQRVLENFIRTKGFKGGPGLVNELRPLLDQLDQVNEKDLAMNIQQMIQGAARNEKSTKGMSWGMFAQELSNKIPELIRKRTNQGVKEDDLDEACWKGYHKDGMKTMFGKRYPNCVKNKNESLEVYVNRGECPGCGGVMVAEDQINEKQDACYHKVKSRYKVWPSAYASGALVQCRKKGADNWGNKSESVDESYTGVMQSQGITDDKLLEVARKIDLFAKTVK